MSNVQIPPADIPIAFADPVEVEPITKEQLITLARSFSTSTPGECCRGPAFVSPTGEPCVVLITRNERLIRRLRQDNKFSLIAWRWDISPSMFVSFTVALADQTPRPHARWMGSSESAVIRAIQSAGQFLVTVATPEGSYCGWHRATISRADLSRSRTADRSAFDRLWLIPKPGIPNSSVNVRFEMFDARDFEQSDEIPLWSDSEADFWKTLAYEGPWKDDLNDTDRLRGQWAKEFWRKRFRAAGAVQVLIERRTRDREQSPLDESGRVREETDLVAPYNRLVESAPSIGEWVALLAGSSPDALKAHQKVVAILKDPSTAFRLLSEGFALIGDLPISDLAQAAQYSFEAGLVDSSLTESGLSRPWLANTGSNGLSTKMIRLDSSLTNAELQDIWVQATEMVDLIDSGLYLRGHDVPVPFEELIAALDSVVVEGSIDSADDKVGALLQEAQDARQWSIPWGARVEVAFGPFNALRIFDLGGEFACHFLDENERYLPVAIGVDKNPPRANTMRILRRRHDDGELLFNEDAEASLKLIAAAVVRDFLVVEDRESLFGARNLRRRVRGRDVRTVIYLPRVRYSSPRVISSEVLPAGTPRARHSVTQHFRRSKEASAAQRFLAQRFGIRIPQGFTFVRAHERGTGTNETRVRVYRSRSASKMLFEEIASTPHGTRPAWFDFEKDCARLLRSLGMHVIHRAAHRDADGGVDLFAVDPEGMSYVVQCKCWAAHREIPPSVIRELAGSISLADSGSTRVGRGMVITTSRFSSGAIETARHFGFELIDGIDLTRRLTAMESS